MLAKRHSLAAAHHPAIVLLAPGQRLLPDMGTPLLILVRRQLIQVWLRLFLGRSSLYLQLRWRH
jgi:hypothetical protein